MENLNSKQLETLSKFRETVVDVLKPDHDDYFLLRWLKARNFDIKKSENMLRKSLEWRESYGADRLLTEWDPPEVLKKYWPGGVFGFDKEGHPILWQLSRDFDSKAMLKSVKKSDIIKYHIYRMEHIMRLCKLQSEKLGKRITSSVHISDLDGFSLGQVFAPGITDMMKHIFALIEANYPENLHSSYVINAPGVFPVFFNILRPFLSEATKRKVHILGRSWQNELFGAINKDQIPEFWGGTAKMGSSPNNFAKINHGQPVPEEYFKETVSIDREKMQSVTVARNHNHRLEFEVTESGTVLRWTFETDTYDIGFGVFRYPVHAPHTKENLEEIIPTTRLNTQSVPEAGNLRCNKPGTYVMRFDNSYSWMNSKTVYYDVEMMVPDKDPELFGDLSDEHDSVIIETTHL